MLHASVVALETTTTTTRAKRRHIINKKNFFFFTHTSFILKCDTIRRYANDRGIRNYLHFSKKKKIEIAVNPTLYYFHPLTRAYVHSPFSQKKKKRDLNLLISFFFLFNRL